MTRNALIIIAGLLCGGAAHAQPPQTLFLPGSAILIIVPPVGYVTPSEEEIYYSPAEEARKTAARVATGYRDPNSRPMCPPPFRMSERDGCR